MTATIDRAHVWKNATAGLLAATALCLAPRPAGAVGGSGEAEARWIPSVTVGVDIHVQSGEVETNSETIVTPIIPLAAELMGPQLGDLPGRPRLFVHGGWQFPTESFHFLDKEDDPPSHIEAELRGQLYGGIGVAWTLPLLERKLRIKTSVDYLRSWMHVETEGRPDPSDHWRESGAFDCVGPRFALETEAGRRGPVSVGLYLQAQVYWILGDRELGPFHLNSTIAQGGAGVRLSWVGFSR